MIYSMLAYLGEIVKDMINHYYLLIDLVFIFYVTRFERDSKYFLYMYMYFSCHVWSSEVYRTSSLGETLYGYIQNGMIRRKINLKSIVQKEKKNKR